MGRRFSLTLKGDNVTALTLALRMKSPPGPLKAIAKEIAMILTKSPYRPRAAKHIPGLANPIADALSRKFDPSKKDTWKLPAELADAVEIKLAARTNEYYIVPYSSREPVGYGAR